jgi:hypothetical protein
MLQHLLHGVGMLKILDRFVQIGIRLPLFLHFVGFSNSVKYFIYYANPYSQYGAKHWNYLNEKGALKSASVDSFQQEVPYGFL